MEHKVHKGYFLAPKAYALDIGHDDNIIKYKGPAKGTVNLEWFVLQYNDPSEIKVVDIESSFNINWHTFTIGKKESQYSLGTPASSKRDHVYDENNKWINTQPKEVIDFGGQDNTIIKLDNKELMKVCSLLREQLSEKNKEIVKYKQELQNVHANKEQDVAKNQLMIPSLDAAVNLPDAPRTEYPTILDLPTLYKDPPKKKAEINQRMMIPKACCS
ncbi:uncharacterized protein LOC122060651 [Macadamia integrifolia]|uniref:uncharacterized protein LOC122060651 n=1 Tax=Macadamia integrifolia TaxID=60698 RepID=UPI001C5338E6|nr:uncharacterized protein LOC122060651 [Macadamia integrifolia]